MNYTKTIVCLANSRKLSGRCIAGKEKTTDGFGGWVGPVSNRTTGEVSEYDRRYLNGDDPKVLDIIEIPMLQHHPHNYQTENHLIDERCSWSKVGQFEKNQLHVLADTIEKEVWVNGHSSQNGIHDRIPEKVACRLSSSLYLLELDQLRVLVCTEGSEYGCPKRRVRAEFIFQGIQYKFAVTDPSIERAFLKKQDGQYPLWGQRIYVCVSIGEPYKGYCYKLIASVIPV